MSSFVSWKGKTLNQILTKVQKNENSTIITPGNMHLAPPLKIYRKETNYNTQSKSSKMGITINSFEIPNGYIIPTNINIINSTIATLDVINTNNNEICSVKDVCFSPQQNAKRELEPAELLNKTIIWTPNSIYKDVIYHSNKINITIY